MNIEYMINLLHKLKYFEAGFLYNSFAIVNSKKQPIFFKFIIIVWFKQHTNNIFSILYAGSA